jgi:hypothetical protein
MKPKKPPSNVKLYKRQLPPNTTPADFTYVGKPSVEQADYLIGEGRAATVNPEYGVADMVCVNQFGEANNAKGYHAGVVKNNVTGEHHLYCEWGRCRPGKSWDGTHWTGAHQEFQFTMGASLDQAQAWFAGQVADKNTKRLERKTVGGIDLWCGRKGKDGYLIQDLATREKGLPDVLTIKDGEGVQASQPIKKAAPALVKSLGSWHPEVTKFAKDLVGGTQTYTRALSAASGVTPTMRSIVKVRDQLIPAALQRLAAIGSGFPDSETLVAAQVADSSLRAISTTVNSLIPRPIPRTGWTDEQAILNSGNLLSIQQDLDAFESALTTEDFTATTPSNHQVDPDALLNAQLRFIDPKGAEGKWLWDAFTHMSNNRHGYLGSKPPRVRSMFEVTRKDRDARFMANVKQVAQRVQGNVTLRANLQPKRADLKGIADEYAGANVAMMIHGTRPVNIAPILGTNFRLPKSLPGAQITGANFGHGIYFASDWRKSYGYTGRGYYGGGGGGVSNRQCFMFINDMVMGQAYRAPSTGSWGSSPKSCVRCNRPTTMAGTYSSYRNRSGNTTCQCGGQQVESDSVFGVGGDAGHGLQNDEHIIFSPDRQRIRYVVEFDWLT